jgi:hypothetical protein
MAQDPERLGRFGREAKALAQRDHPNIVTIHSVEECDGIHFPTMQLVEGFPRQGWKLRRKTSRGVSIRCGTLFREGVRHATCDIRRSIRTVRRARTGAKGGEGIPAIRPDFVTTAREDCYCCQPPPRAW